MSTLKVDNIRHNSATSDAITMASDGTCTAKITSIGGGGLSHRNIIINGAMTVAQRASSTTSNGYKFVDRFQTSVGSLSTGGNVTRSQQSLSSSDTGPWQAGFRKYARMATVAAGTAAAGSSIDFYTHIEAQDMANSGWNYTSSSSYVTFSYWVKSSVPQNFFVTLKSGDGTPQKYATETGSLTADTWTKITKTIPGASNVQFDNDNGEGLEIEWSIFRGTDLTGSMSLNAWAANNNSVRTPDQTSTFFTTNGATFEITGGQLEVGPVATSFEHRSIGEELHRCQRYFYMCADGTRGKSGTNRAPICTGAMYNSSNFNGVVNFPVEMRTTPSLYKVVGSGYFRIWGNGGSDGCNDVVLEGSSPQCGIANIYDGLSQTSGSATWATTDNAACRLGFQAEL